MKRILRRLTSLLTAAVLMSAPAFSAPADRSGHGGMLRAAAAVSIPGIDVSKYQEEIDWQEVARSDVKFAILRCCKVIRAYDDWELDPTFEENYEKAKAAGIAVGCYLFTDAATEQEFLEDVGYMLGFLQDKSFEFPVFLDMESPIRQEHLPPEVFMPALLAGLEKIEDAGHTAGVYSSSAFFSECIDRSQLLEAGYPIWEANYFDTTNGLTSPVGHDLSAEATIWQYSGCGRCPGIRTTVDRNICYTYQFFNHQAVIANSVLPTDTLKAGSNFTLAGTVSSGTVLRTITGSIYRKDNPAEPVQSVTVYPRAREYKLTGFFTKKLIFSTLPEDSYELRITAVDSSGTEIEVVNTPFEIGAGDLPSETEHRSDGNDSSQPMPEFHFAGQGHLHETTAPADSSRSGGLNLQAWLFRHMSLRRVLTTATRIGNKLRLERTPLYRIVSKSFYKLEAGYLISNLCAAHHEANPETE